jgi:hypothetical protein
MRDWIAAISASTSSSFFASSLMLFWSMTWNRARSRWASALL